MWWLVLCFWGVGAACAAGSCAGSYCSLVQSCRGGGFFTPFRYFHTSFGAISSFQGIFSACAGIPWLPLGCCLFAPYASPTLRPSPAVAGLVICAADLLTGCHWGCVWVLSGAAELCLSPPAGCGVGCCWATDCCLLLCLFLRRWRSFRSVSCRRLPLRGYANFSGSSCLSCSCGGALSLGFAVSLVWRLVFHLVRCFSSWACGFGQLPLPQVACLWILPPYAWPASALVA